MKIQVLKQLNEKQRRKVERLLDDCRDYEPITLTPPLTREECFDPKLPCFYLLYEEQELISFLSLFLPDPYYGEAMAFTHPMARRRGYFKELWNEVLIRLDDYIQDMELLFVTDGQSPDALAALEAMEGEYQYSEYIMEKSVDTADGQDGNGEDEAGEGKDLRVVQVWPASQLGEDPSEVLRAECVRIHEEIFCDGMSASEAFIREMLAAPQTRTFLAYYRGQAAGIFHLTEWENGTHLSGFGLLPQFQGQGLGGALLDAAAGQLAPGHGLMSLQVSSLNEAACRLYRAKGFSQTMRRDYYY